MRKLNYSVLTCHVLLVALLVTILLTDIFRMLCNSRRNMVRTGLYGTTVSIHSSYTKASPNTTPTAYAVTAGSTAGERHSHS